MNYTGFIVFVAAIPLGFLLESIIAHVYVSWAACRRNRLLSPVNVSFTVSIIAALFTLLYVKPSIESLAGLLTGFMFELGYDYGRWFDRLDNFREECLTEKARLDEDCRKCYMMCIDKCKHVEIKE